ncbi:MAG: 50S ribosome-binding GTPase, partial [Selenomonadales bacterium]|nr:50S ribosome-binding GTPase [Selenomonadales bacterium]
MNRRDGFFRWWGGLFCASRSANGQSDGSGDDGRKGHRGRGRTVDDGQKGHLSNHGKTVVLAGNPNVGKSVFFTALSGIYREVSNYAGTTVDVGCARLGRDTLIDTPGVYGIGSASEEERVAREVILSADIVINIVDAVHLSRDLFLTIQLTITNSTEQYLILSEVGKSGFSQNDTISLDKEGVFSKNIEMQETTLYSLA